MNKNKRDHTNNDNNLYAHLKIILPYQAIFRSRIDFNSNKNKNNRKR